MEAAAAGMATAAATTTAVMPYPDEDTSGNSNGGGIELIQFCLQRPYSFSASQGDPDLFIWECSGQPLEPSLQVYPP